MKQVRASCVVLQAGKKMPSGLKYSFEALQQGQRLLPGRPVYRYAPQSSFEISMASIVGRMCSLPEDFFIVGGEGGEGGHSLIGHMVLCSKTAGDFIGIAQDEQARKTGVGIGVVFNGQCILDDDDDEVVSIIEIDGIGVLAPVSLLAEDGTPNYGGYVTGVQDDEQG